MPTIQPMPSGEMTGAVTPQTTPPSLKMENVPLPVVEPKSTKEVETKIEAETSPQDSVRIASMIRKEKQLLKRARELQEREKKITEVQSQYQPWLEANELAKLNKLEAIKKLGISYDDLTQQVLNNGNLPPEVVAQQRAEHIVQQRLEEFEKKQADLQVQNQQLQYKQAIQSIDAEVQNLVNSSDKYPLVKNTEAYNDVTRFIESEFHRTGKVLPVVEAVEKWHSEIKEGFKELAKNLSREELQEILGALQGEPQKTPVSNPEPNQKITTLTHKATVNTPITKALTDAERRQKAIDAFYGRI